MSTPTECLKARSVEVHICLECGAIWDRPIRCPFNDAYSPTVPADQVASDLLRAETNLDQLLEAVRGHGEPESWYWQDNKRLYQVADEIEKRRR